MAESFVSPNLFDAWMAFCKEVCSDEKTHFPNFRQNSNLRGMVDTVTEDQGRNYYKLIKDKTQVRDFIDLIGNPVCAVYDGLSICPTTLRYLKVAQDLSDMRQPFSIVEIGGGYGGQCNVMKRWFGDQLEQYWIFDLPDVLNLTSLYLQAHNISDKNVTLVPVNDPKKTATETQNIQETKGTLILSNYCLSECVPAVQDGYVRTLFPIVNGGYLTMNTGLDPIKRLQSFLEPMRFHHSVERENPLTGEHNYLWRFDVIT